MPIMVLSEARVRAGDVVRVTARLASGTDATVELHAREAGFDGDFSPFCPSDYGPAEVRADGLPTIGRPIFATLHSGRRRAGWEFRAPVAMTLRLVDPYTRPVADRGVPAGRVVRVPAWRLAVEAWLARAISQFNRGKAVFASKG